MADTTLPAVTAEVATPTLLMADGQPTATSLQVAEHFGKRHRDVLRAIRDLDCSEGYRERNFALTMQAVPGPKGAMRDEPMYRITRDGFAFLAMGFTGKEAARWKEAYINAFNAMEAKLRSLYVEPLVNDKQFRMGIPMHLKFKLQEQSRRTMRELLAEPAPAAKRNLYWQLHQINDALGIPTESMAALDVAAPALEGGAA